MDKSTHKCEVVQIGRVDAHFNADRLETTMIFGYSVCIGKGDFKSGDLGIYIPPDSIVPEIPQFKFIWESKYAPAPGVEDTSIPVKYRRIKAKVLRGVISEGLLMPLTAFMDWFQVDDGGFPIYPAVGTDLAELLHIAHYEPSDNASVAGDQDATPGKPKQKRYPKTLRGWYRFLLSKIAFWREPVDQQENTGFTIPAYDIDAWQRYKHLLQPGETVWITEKIHGANARFTFTDGRMYVGSHYQWKKDMPGSAFWEAVRQNPWIEEFCMTYPDLVLYGELVPTQKLKYGQEPGKYRIFAFDVLDPRLKGPGQPQGKWYSYADLSELDFVFHYQEGEDFVPRKLLDEIHWVPTVALVAYDEETVRGYSSGKSIVEGANHIREGVVIRPMVERSNPRFGRVILKIVSAEYLGSKQSDE